MQLHAFTRQPATNTKRRVGRGIAAGQGKTAGRGTKGQKSRSGYNLPRKFEGGQTPLILRLPKARGFKQRHNKPFIVDRALINTYFKDDEVVSPTTLMERKLVPQGTTKIIKIIGAGPITVKISFEDVRQSRSSDTQK